MASLFYKDIKYLKGIGEKRAKLFYKLGVRSVGALLQFYPRDYKDFSQLTKIADTTGDGKYCICATVVSDIKTFKSKNNIFVCKFSASDSSSSIDIIFFNQRYVANSIKKGREYLFYGKITQNGLKKELVSPIFRSLGEDIRIEPIYKQTQGLGSGIIQKAVKTALDDVGYIENDTLPENIRKKYGLCSLDFALKNIHFPCDNDTLKKAQYRISFEQLLCFYMSIKSLKHNNSTLNINKIDSTFRDEFTALLPFELTNAQKKVLDKCLDDFRKKRFASSILIQGDVGCGKTVVSASLAFCAVKSGFQVAIMTPTEILASQHYDYFSGLFCNQNITVRLLSSSTTAKRRKEILKETKDGVADILIGTHSLLSDDVKFNSLALVITDEQHRFGVNQREKLYSKGQSPHIVVMSATPIPRTLAMVLFSDYDILVIDELPKGRKDIKTYAISSKKRADVFSFIKDKIDNSQQAYIVCPTIEDNPDCELSSIENYKELIEKSPLSECEYAFLHGKMKDKEKQQIMLDFAKGKTKLLISTTVIEVGVDVPNASVMLVENAERFGFSQLHQLRGRVGRGNTQSYCFLLSDSQSLTSRERLKTLCRTNDGFKIASEDLKLRGPGNFFGVEQHGNLSADIFNNLNNSAVFEKIISAYKDIIADDPNLTSSKYRFLRGQINMRLNNIVF